MTRSATGTRASALSEAMLEELFLLEDAAELAALLDRNPELRGAQVQDELRTLAEIEGFGAGFARIAELLKGAETDPSAAWATFERDQRRADALAHELEREVAEIDRAVAGRNFDRVIGLADAAIPRASAAGLGTLVCRLQGQRGWAFLQRGSEDRARDLEAAIEAHEIALRLATNAEEAVQLLMHLAIAYGDRVRGDRAENMERAHGLLRAALDEVATLRDPALRAMVQTNLAIVVMRRERGDRIANLRDAESLCRAALAYRSPKRDAVDWAYSQLNLAEALAELADQKEGSIDHARHTFLAVIKEADRVRDAWLVGLAHHGLGRSFLSEAELSAEDILEALEHGESDVNFEDLGRLEKARRHLEAARWLMGGTPNPIHRGRVLADLAEALAKLGRDEAALAAARDGLVLVRPSSHPQACLRIGGRLGDLLAIRGEWAEASRAFGDAVESAEFMFHTRLDTRAREQEALKAGNINRWAAFAIARAGDPMRAALVLENGRARELRRRLGIDAVAEDRLADLPPDLATLYRRAVESLSVSGFGDAGDAAARHLQEVVGVIRETPGFEDFSTGARPHDLAEAVEPGWPLVYVDPTPYGTVLLLVDHASVGCRVEASFLEDLGSLDVFARLIAGDAADVDDLAAVDHVSSYLMGISGEGESDRDDEQGLSEFLPWLGETIARPVRAMLAERDTRGVTLVVCGPIANAPLHAAPWREEGRELCLLDLLTVRYAPSAVVMRAALRRAARRTLQGADLVAVADPTEDLDAARAEVVEIAKRFSGRGTACAFGRDAVRKFLEDRARGAGALHLACHASGALFEGDAHVVLADGEMDASELTTLGPLRARVVTISACQTAMTKMADLAHEVISIGTVFLASGAACTIATLWPVDDFATALLMTRLYEEMLDADDRPPEALRRAQLWLRDLTAGQEKAFVASHPALADAFSDRVRRNQDPGDRHSSHQGDIRPYARPAYWAAFVATGA